MSLSLCMPHRDMLKREILGSEVGHLVSGSSGELMERMWADPLWDAFIMIQKNFIENLVEVWGMDTDEVEEITAGEEPVCGICWNNEHCDCERGDCCDSWIKLAARDTVVGYRTLNN